MVGLSRGFQPEEHQEEIKPTRVKYTGKRRDVTEEELEKIRKMMRDGWSYGYSIHSVLDINSGHRLEKQVRVDPEIMKMRHAFMTRKKSF